MERVLEAKVLPPVLPKVRIDRPRVEAALGEALSRRLTAVVAPAGFGKSTLLAAWADANRCAWYSVTEDDNDLETLFGGVVAALRLRVTGLGEAVRDVAPLGRDRGPDAAEEETARAVAHAAHLSRLLEDRMASELVLVLDDLHELDAESASVRFIEALCRQGPRHLHLVILTRDELPFPTARLRAQGQAAELTATMLAFDVGETEALSIQVVGSGATDAARRLHEATLGWPAAVRLGTESLRDHAHLDAAADQNLTPEGIVDLLAGEVFERAEPEVTDLVRAVAPLDGFTAGLCRVLGVSDPAPVMATLERRGLLLSHGAGGGWFSLHPLVRRWARIRLADAVDEGAVLRRAAGWMLDAGHVREAAQLWWRAGATDDLARVLTDHGRTLLGDNSADDVLRFLDAVDPADHENADELRRLEGEARFVTGDWDGALATVIGRTGDDALPPDVAWRTGLIHYHRGDLDRALAHYERAAPTEPVTADHAMVDALAAAVWWLRGDFDRCRKLAERSHEVATIHQDDRALAAAHTALAMVAAVTGDRRTNDAHYLRALTHAEAAGDVLQLIRIHTNRGSRYMEEGDYADALAETDAAIAMADLAGYGMQRALALSNRGDVLCRTGRLDEAMRDLHDARSIYERVGSHNLNYPLALIGRVHAIRNETALAVAAYEEAVELVSATGDVQGLVPALVGLAETVMASDLQRAAELADQAVGAGPTLGHPDAILVQGRVALAAGDRERARDRAGAATEVARAQRDRAALAAAVELTARASDDPDEAHRLLTEAASSWGRLGHVLDEARVRVLLGHSRNATTTDHAAAAAARSMLLDAGARRDTVLAERSATAGPVASVSVLGSFRVTVGGRDIGPTDWGSRKPRDLLKLLIARRGPVRRDLVLDTLWVDDDPKRSARKLSVVLSTLRSLLDPDRRFDQDHFLVADRDAVWLADEHWDIDLEAFITAATEGLRLVEAGDEQGLAELAWVESTFDGEAFEEDAYEEWTTAVREQVRSLSVATIRALATTAVEGTETDRAVRLLLRLLGRDHYDEPAHRRLVGVLRSAGRHGEARRMYQTYCERMDEIGIEPVPYPDA